MALVSSRPSRASSPPLATWTMDSGSTRLALRPATMKTQFIRPALLLFVVESTQGWPQVSSLVCPKVLVEISCADVAVAWSPPACDKKINSVTKLLTIANQFKLNTSS